MLDWSSLLQHYGYFAIIIGTFFEGETILLLGAYAVHQHMLNFWLLIAAAMLGGFIGDQLYYQIGAKYGYAFIQQRPKLDEKFQRASQLIERYPTLSILLMRFAWGLRTAIPMSFGIKKYSRYRYITVNILACFIWAFIIVSVGLQISHWLHVFWKFLMPHQHKIVIIGAVMSSIIILRIVYSGFIRVQKRKNKV
ncbi:DedA family protein [Acinetobacter silvestris]|uniref:DedA family protein n=1 Tax=Acinetobacter silvestris TaxID=1977882 RepID=A0A1Y3CK95_9GAMM|nr:DedA family protein [Acinetobacter silvestris]OTG65553.1 DedA family protein [Acinetobacter silvestris]